MGIELWQFDWQRQNEATDEDGLFLTDEAGFEHERRTLAERGCPDTEHVEFIQEIVEDRDTSFYVAQGTKAMHEWLLKEEITQNEIEMP